MALILFDDDPFPYHGKRKMKASKTLCWSCSLSVEKDVCSVKTLSPAPAGAQGCWWELLSPGAAKGLQCKRQSSENFS